MEAQGKARKRRQPGYEGWRRKRRVLGDRVREFGGTKTTMTDGGEEGKAGGLVVGVGRVEVRGGRKESEQQLPGNVRRESECRV